MFYTHVRRTGEWLVEEVARVDEANGYVYFLATEAGHHRQSARLDGAPARLLRLLRPRQAALGQLGTSGAEAQPLGPQPPPRLLKRAASKVADSTAF